MSNPVWPTAPLSKLTSRIGDGIHGTPVYSESGGYPFVNGNNLKSGSIEITNDTKRVSREEYDKYFIEFDEKTLFLSINGTLGNLAKYKGEEVVLGKSAAYINCTGINIDFLFYYFQLKEVKALMWNIATGSTIKNLSLASIRNMEVPNPPEKVAKKISDVLLAIDKKIELNNRINAELEAMAKTLYEYWFVQFDFPDENGKPYKASGGRMVFDSELNREIPMGWTTKSLGEIVDIVKGNVSPKEVSSSTPYIGLEHIQRKNLALIDWASSDIAASNKTIFKEGDILFGKIRPYFHKVTVAPFDGITSTDTLVFRPKSHKLYGLVLEVIFSGEFVEIASQSSTGSKMPRADWNVLKNYPVVIPQDDLLEKFQGLIDKYCKKLKSITIENHELRNLRDWLLPMLMNGQVTVKPSTESKEAQHG
ncbi:hypothetical protein J7288_003563 [Vibrio parahaemolyticus]|nr:hypothetical protein [Vibrio parahaemolyticus]EJG0970914.1 restriction endonuclease subunit S [Vibrio parahaemolyticus]